MIVNLKKLVGFLKSLSTAAIKHFISQEAILKGGVAYWRGLILLAILLPGAIFGPFILVPSVYLTIKENMWIVAVVDTTMYAVVIWLLFDRRLSYTFKAVVLLANYFLVGIVVSAWVGLIGGSGTTWLFFFAIMAALLLGLRPAIVALIFSSLAFLGLVLMDYWNLLPSAHRFFTGPERVIPIVANFVVLNILSALSVATMLRGLDSLHQRNTKALDDLKRSEEKYRQTAELLPETVFELDLEGRLQFINWAAYDTFGYGSGDNLLGTLAMELFIPQDRERALSNMNSIIGTGQSNVAQYTCLRKDGSTFPVMSYAGPILQDGKAVGSRGIIVDITNQVLLRQAQKIESIGNLAGGIAHDFNNILFPIVGMSELLLEDLPSDSNERECVEEIFKAGKRGSDLVKQILTFSRQSEEKMMPTRIQNVLNEVIKLSRSTIPTYIEVKQDIQQNCGMVMADPSQIHQIGMNIITNAYHAAEYTGGTISINLKQTVLEVPESLQINLKPGSYAVISISDTGHGMSEELISKIFDPYFTTKEQGKGTGLGLAVVYGIVKEHGGDIKVYSEIGKGSTFEIYLPLMKKNTDTESIPAVEVYQGGDERILLVDDEESVAKLEKQMLERMGYKVTSRLHSVEALEAFKARPSSFDLVVTDMNMPNIPGDELARKMLDEAQGKT